MPRCKHCKIKFVASEFNQKHCKQTDDCKVAEAMSKLSKIKAKQQKDWNERKKKMTDQLKTYSDWCKELQVEINTIARLIDKGSICISSLKPLNDKFDAGHRFSTAAFPSLRFHLFNIHAQSVNQNQYLSGNPDGYDHGLSCVYGENYLNEVHSLKTKYPKLKPSIPEIIAAKEAAKRIVKTLRRLDRLYLPDERIELRRNFNKVIGLYKH